MIKTPMHQAIESADEGITLGHGGPFGACIVQDNKVIAVAHNTVLRDSDPTAHAEMNVIRLAAKNLGTEDLSNCHLYTTSEPCPMCLGAIFWARLSKMTIGVPKSVAAEFGFDDVAFYDRLLKSPQDLICETGALATECRQLFEKWRDLEGTLY